MTCPSIQHTTWKDYSLQVINIPGLQEEDNDI